MIDSGNDAVDVPAQHAGYISDRLALTKSHLLRRQVNRVSAKLRHSEVKTDPRPERGFLKQQCDRPPWQEAAHAALLHDQRLFQKLYRCIRRQVSNRKEISLHRLLVYHGVLNV